jgi:nucleoid-associated protein YgaU
MRSLNAHLRQPDQHARLPFHPECPICRRERLVGSLPSDGLISRRAQAVIAAGVLALSAAAPVGTYAQEPDQTNEGTSAPEEIGGGDPTHSPDFDPGGESTDLPFDSPPTTEVEAPPDPEDADAGPLEQEPTTDVDAPVADGGDEPSHTGAQPETQPSPPAAQPSPVTPSPPETPAATPTPSPTPPPEAPTTTAEPPPADTDDAAPAGKPQSKAKREKPKERPDSSRETAPEPTATLEPGSAAPAASTSEQAVPAAQAAPAPVFAVARGTGDEAQPGDRSHVVRLGESLWSIAADHLGDQATVARIAREVNRLWELNRECIGTGSPDLLRVGTRLTLR